MALTPDRIVALKGAAEMIQAAGHGNKTRIALDQARLLGVDVKSLYRQIEEAGFSAPRKRRADAGQLAVSRDEAMRLMAIKKTAQRANGKDGMAISNAARLGRANGIFAMGRLDQDSGELVPVSDSAIQRAVRHYGLDMKTLNRPAPHRGAKSLHPNHVWQVDASVCVLYYLDDGGLGVMEKDEFYKNKPENFTKRAKQMVIRYVCTDHYTGTVFFLYYLGAESGEMLCEFFISCLQAKDNEKEPFHGVPFIVVLDPGAANKGSLFQNLCRLLGIKVIIHRPKNPRAKGSVEKHNDLIERGFETMLVGKKVNSLEQLNAEAAVWRRWFNGVCKHSRHGHTRFGLWQTIRADQLRIAPDAGLCRQLMTGKTEKRDVRGDLSIAFGGASYDVRHIPHLNIGQKVEVARSPYRTDAILLIEQDEHKRDVHWVCPQIALDAGGFRADAATWGEDIKGMPDTPAVRDMKALEQLAYGVDGKLEVDAARRARQPIYGGLDISSHLAAATPASYMARPGTELDITTPVVQRRKEDLLASPATIAVEARQLNLVQLVTRLSAALVGEWSADHYHQVASWYPAGALESDVGAIVERLRGFTEPPRLRAVGGA